MNPAGMRRYGAGDWQFRTGHSPTNLGAVPSSRLVPGALNHPSPPASPGRPYIPTDSGSMPPPGGGSGGDLANKASALGVGGAGPLKDANVAPKGTLDSGGGGAGGGGTGGGTGTGGGGAGGGAPVSQYTDAQKNQTWNTAGKPGVLGAAYDTNAQFNNNIGSAWNQGYVGPNGQSGSWPTGQGAPNYYSMYYGGSGGGAPGNNGPMGGSTDPSQYMSGSNYMYNLDLNAALQQANQINYNKANNGPGGGSAYTQIDMGKFNSWYDQAMAALANGQDAPPQDFWINGPDYAQTTSNPNPNGYPGMPSSFGSTGAAAASGSGAGGGGGATAMADGGIVTKPTKAILGENGPEAVVPLHPGSRPRLDTGMLGGMAGNPVPTIRPHLSRRVGAPMPSPLRQARRYGTVGV